MNAPDTDRSLFAQPHTLATTTGAIDAEWIFDSHDPCAVVLSMRAEYGLVEWFIARDLLRAGLGRTERNPAGEGDVTVHVDFWRSPHRSGSLVIDLRSPDGEMRLWADRAAVAAFLTRTARAVPARCEGAAVARQVDAAIAWCLGSETA